MKIGSRVALMPWLDRWMMGDRFGTVVKIGRKFVHVELDVSGKTRKFLESNLREML